MERPSVRHYRRIRRKTRRQQGVWGSTFDHNNGNLIDRSRWLTSESLMRSVLGRNAQVDDLFPSIGLGDLIVGSRSGSCDDILIGTLKFPRRYDWSTRSTSQVVVGVDLRNPIFCRIIP
jgi:hypothetical protein